MKISEIAFKDGKTYEVRNGKEYAIWLCSGNYLIFIKNGHYDITSSKIENVYRDKDVFHKPEYAIESIVDWNLIDFDLTPYEKTIKKVKSHLL